MCREKEEENLSQTKAELVPLCAVKTEAVKSSWTNNQQTEILNSSSS